MLKLQLHRLTVKPSQKLQSSGKALWTLSFGNAQCERRLSLAKIKLQSDCLLELDFIHSLSEHKHFEQTSTADFMRFIFQHIYVIIKYYYQIRSWHRSSLVHTYRCRLLLDPPHRFRRVNKDFEHSNQLSMKNTRELGKRLLNCWHICGGVLSLVILMEKIKAINFHCNGFWNVKWNTIHCQDPEHILTSWVPECRPSGSSATTLCHFGLTVSVSLFRNQKTKD